MSTLFEREATSVMQTYGRVPVVFVRGEGARLFDEDGRGYLDCLGGLAVTSLGHANPAVTQAVVEQMSLLVHVSNLYYTEPQVDLAERLKALSGLDRVFFSNDGATANEAAIKLARRWGQDRRGPECFEIITLDGSFHGRTLATLAATGQPAKQARFEPLPAGFIQVPPGDFPSLEAAISRNTAAVMVETVQGEGGVIPLEADYLQSVRRLCDQYQVALIVDDVQAGMGRTGHWFSWQALGFSPDIATVAKALANGLPIGACLTTEEAASAFLPGDHASTFGGGPVVCRAALATIDQLEGLVRPELGESLRQGLREATGVVEVRGRGLLLAAVLDSAAAAEVTQACFESGLLVNAVRPDAVRFAPSLTISPSEVEEAVDKFAAAVRKTLLGDKYPQ